ncbi:hypothetical protein APR04_003879 [Promicromonospora umidemergens]|uniref:Uncharacterized protein n=2 Tax=Promicromonospora TaxID=43676 RepID=A0ABP8XJ66_9MICO|nr:hypothetical protein [Promicromonospora umidemergens]MCP2284956.1 hypothetical protein [Promicromonospora umidemergens]
MTLTWQQSLGLYVPVLIAARAFRLSMTTPAIRVADDAAQKACDAALEALHAAAVPIDLAAPDLADELLSVVLASSDELRRVAGRGADGAKVDELAADYDQAVAALRARMRTDLAAASAAQG